jgi:hypothetical protein
MDDSADLDRARRVGTWSWCWRVDRPDSCRHYRRRRPRICWTGLQLKKDYQKSTYGRTASTQPHNEVANRVQVQKALFAFEEHMINKVA